MKTTPPDSSQSASLLRSKLFWVGILYFAEGFPLGIFYDIFPVLFRQQGVELWKIGFMSLLGLAWTLKFIWAPAVDRYRHHRRWMALVDLGMGGVMIIFALHTDFGAWVWFGIGLFTLLSATHDIAVDGYTIEMLDRHQYGVANGLRIGFYRVGMLAAGFLLILSDYIGWAGTFVIAFALFALLAALSLRAPSEQIIPPTADLHPTTLRHELQAILRQPWAMALVVLFILGTLWLAESKLHWSDRYPLFWFIAAGIALLPPLFSLYFARKKRQQLGAEAEISLTTLRNGPMFGALFELLSRPLMLPIILFILIFKLGDSSMGFMIKPFWVDAGFSASEIGLVSVNIGLVLSIAGGIVGGWITDRIGIFHGLWSLGLAQAFSNLGYAYAAATISIGANGGEMALEETILIYSASGLESFTGGLGTAAFLAFLMAITNRQRAATEYAILSSIFALSRSLAGWAGGFGAEMMGYAPYFLLTFFLAFPAYLLLPQIYKTLRNQAP
ncbi:MAG: MFS transporter [Gammaproteobacteria bacterium]|nr:MFS transporter [Gammaproteobacteria bacterium]